MTENHDATTPILARDIGAGLTGNAGIGTRTALHKDEVVALARDLIRAIAETSPRLTEYADGNIADAVKELDDAITRLDRAPLLDRVSKYVQLLSPIARDANNQRILQGGDWLVQAIPGAPDCLMIRGRVLLDLLTACNAHLRTRDDDE